MGHLEPTLPSVAYRSDEVFAREREGIFFREWLCLGRNEDMPAVGGVRVVDVLGESLLIARTEHGPLRAHYNVCRHRGARLCPAPGTRDALGPGRTPGRTFRCPYHSWTYDFEGRLLSAPHLSADGIVIERESFGLHPVGVDIWQGFVFLNLTPAEAQSGSRTLARQLGEIPERLSRYPLEALREAFRIDYDVAANWKVIAENYNECYHCGPVHPELCDVVPAFRHKGGADLDWNRGVPHRPGAFTFTLSGTTTRAAFSTLSEEEKVRHKGEIVYPNLFLSLSADHVAVFYLWPLTAERSRVSCSFLFHPDEIARPDFDPRDAIEFWDLINRQDWEICEEVQRGMRSRIHTHGYYAPMEDQSLDIRRYVTDRIGQV
ncbi:MAG: SRPBCC family protein [Vicinamibacteria bacterium]